MEIGQKVKPLVSVRKNNIGKVVSKGLNPSLPIAVVFDDNVEWDFKENELQKVN